MKKIVVQLYWIYSNQLDKKKGDLKKYRQNDDEIIQSILNMDRMEGYEISMTHSRVFILNKLFSTGLLDEYRPKSEHFHF